MAAMVQKRWVWSRRARLALLAALLLGGVFGPVVLAPVASANHIPYAAGDVFAGVGTGQIKRFSPTGALIEVLNTTSGSSEDTGMCFDASGNLRSTNFSANNMTLFNNQGGVVQQPWAGPFNLNPESCIVDAAGNVYVGQASGTGDVLKFSPGGTLLNSYDVARTARGSDWIDLAADQRTLFYTSEGSTVKRFDVSTNTQLADFAGGLPAPCFALRIRPNGEVLVACASGVHRLSAAGAVIQSYPAATHGMSFMFALNLDPDGTSFWTGDIFSGQIARINIATGAQITTFNAGAFTTMAGLAVFGEPTASQPPAQRTFCPTPPPTPNPSTGDIVGTAGPDQILGTPGNDRIFGLGGNDEIHGLGGEDLIFGGDGDDKLYGHDGNDTLCGENGADFLSGGQGDDKLDGGAGNDGLSGEAGDDTLSGGAGDDRLTGGAGTNTNDGGPGTDSCVSPSPGTNCSP